MKSLLHSIPAAAAGNMTGMTYRSNWGCSFLFCFQSDLGSSCISSNSSTKLEVNLLKFDISRYHRDWHVLARHWHLIDNRFWSYLHHFAWLNSQEYKLRCALAKDINAKVFYICLTLPWWSMMHCNCEVLCKGGKNVSRKTYLRHSKYRNEFSPEFIAFMATASNNLEEVSIISIRASAIISIL